MGNPESADPVGDGEYVVQQGDCLSSIAFENGLLPETIWNDPGNASLKSGRKDQNILFPGDQVHIPDVRIRTESCATDNNHQFLLKSVTEVLRIVLLDSDGKPREGLSYSIRIKGGRTKTGKTDSDGVIEVPIYPNARNGELVVKGKETDEHYELELGALDPSSTVTGIQSRLNHLGFSCGEVDGDLGPKTMSAIKSFQESQNLSVTGNIDDETRNAIVKQHGF
jgi:hypothetical protein